MPIFKELNSYITKLETTLISEKRKKVLDEFSEYLQQKVDLKQEIRLHFICTHNSRRSHLAQVWAQTMAFYFKVNAVFCYSGGTEATKVYPMVIKTLKDTGFEIIKLSDNNNPIYAIKYSDNEHPILAFSKEINHPFNPKKDFAAIMTCSSADEACPIVFGAEKRIPLTYEDPKKYDNTPIQQEKYLERSTQIASEMYYVFSKINQL